MGIRIQPRDIEVPEDDPFKNDLLGRKKPVEVLTHLVGSFEGPCVLAVDAEWGYGKTTFLRIWAQYLRNQRFPVIEFNAWETDFSEDPFVTLSKELMEGLQEIGDESMKEKITAVKKCAKEVEKYAKRATPSIIRVITASIQSITPVVGNALSSYVEEKLSAYGKAKKSIKRFKYALKGMAAKLSETNNGQPLIVIIDELDRCRPSYAVELLEVAKHLFTVNHIVFVLAVNRSELAHSIKALYGSDFDAQEYLRRFFDVDFRLPAPERGAFINEMLSAIRIDDHFKRTKDGEVRNEIGTIRELLHHFFRTHDLSLRTIAQSIHCLGLVFASLGNDRRSFMRAAAVALILRTINADLYYGFVRGEISDEDVVKKIFDRPGASSLQVGHEGCMFEALVILSAQELSGLITSPLYKKYRNMVENEETHEPNETDRKHAEKVIYLVEHFESKIYFNSKEVGFKESAERLELLSPDLLSRE